MASRRNRSSDPLVEQVSTVNPSKFDILPTCVTNFIYDYNTASRAELSKRFFNLTLKLNLTISSIWFNKQCISNKVTPTYAKLYDKQNTAASRKTIISAQILRIKNEIRSLYIKKDQINGKLLHTHLQLANLIQTENFTSLHHEIKERVNTQMSSKYDKLRNKLDKLFTKSSVNKKSIKFHPRTINLSDTKFTTYETNLLDKGLKHNLLTNRTKDIEELIVDTELAIEKIPSDQQTHARHSASDILNKIHQSISRPTPNLDSKTLRHIQRKIQDNNLTVTRADKGNSTVIMKTSTYNEKTVNFIESNGFLKLKKDPTKFFQAQIKDSINRAPNIIPSKSKHRFINPNPSHPILKALPKIHKPNTPIRPVVNYRPSPAYLLSKHVASTIKSYADLDNEHTIKNSLEFTSSASKLSIPNTARMMSLDVTNLYTSIPVNDTLDLLENRLLTNYDRDTTNQIIDLTRTTLKQNYFKFNGNYYSATDGLGMGNPTSSILSEVFMQSLEDVYVQQIADKFGVIYYKRYVDDCFVIIDNTEDKTDDLLTYMNNLHTNIKFTIEKETENSINYLDLNITRLDHKLDFEIYRKPTATDHTLHSSSNHPIQHKLAAYRSMIHRLHTVPLNESNFQKELNTIYDIAYNNGFPRKTIDKIISQSKNKQQNDNKNYPWITLTYIGKETYRLQHFFKKYNLNTAFKTHNQIGHKLKPRNEDINTFNNSGIYRLTCNDCGLAYIGRTGRTLNIRYKEHLRSFIHDKQDSNYANHLQTHGHQPDLIDNSMTLLRKQSMGPRLNVLERLEIFKHRAQTGQIINEQTNFDSDITFNTLKNIYGKRQRDELDFQTIPTKKTKFR